MAGETTDGGRPDQPPQLPAGLPDGLCAVLDHFPVPAGVYGPDGAGLFVNRSFTETFRIDAHRIVGAVNVLADPYLDTELGIAGSLARVFSGEPTILHGVRAPLEEMDNRRLARSPVAVGVEIYQDIACLPVLDDDGSVLGVVALFVTKHVYPLHPAVLAACQHIDLHWRDAFDSDEVADAAGVSRDHLSRLFQRFLGKTPYRYYREVKIDRIKRALRDPELTVSQAFASCGVDYSGSYARAFRRSVGMTPTEYRGSAPTELPAAAPARAAAAQAVPELDEDSLFRVVDLLPIPVQVFRASGEAVFINQAVLRAWNVKDARQIIGSYNLRSDPLVNDRHGLRSHIERAFSGETVLVPDVRIPLETFWESYPKADATADPGAIYTDILNFPLRDAAGRLSYVVSIFLTSRVYRGRTEVARAREYLENHWRARYDADALAEQVGLSSSQLSRVFKQETGQTPYGYYQEVKVARLKELLRNSDLSVSQAFTACGLEHWGNATRFFKERVGLTPTQYRATLHDERRAGF